MHLTKISKTSIILFILSLIILAIGFFLRSRMILNGDFWFTPDQARDMLLAKDVVVNHKPILIGARSGLEGIFHGPLWIYLISIPFAIFKGDPQKVSYFYIFISMALICFASLATYKLYNKWIGFLVLLILSFAQNLYSVINDTTNAHGLPFVLIGFLYSLILFIRGNNKAFLFTIFFAGLAFEFQAAFAIFLFPYTILLALLINRKIFTLKNIIRGIIVYALSLISLILFELRHQFLTTKAVLKIFTHPGGLTPIKGYEQYGNIFFRINDRVSTLIQTPYSILPDRITWLFLITIAIIFYAFITVLKTKKYNKYKKEFILLFFFPFFVYILYIFYPLPIWNHYTFAIPIIMVFLFGLSCNCIWYSRWGKILISLFVISTTWVALLQLKTMYKMPYTALTDGSYINQLHVADAIFQDAKGEKFSYFVYTPPVITYGMDYLLWWRGTQKYNSLPSNQKYNGLMYTILYPNDKDASAHGYFISHVLHTNSQILSTNTYPGQIKVQKRRISEKEAPVDPNYYLNAR
ncbi:MAG TPA: glycosyltransferase family 39 protein [Candidatus Limnocylindrales bacterium]|nr:glycosyltransferase family 39 protein [Candidatus Limnocylindrales bacterium]